MENTKQNKKALPIVLGSYFGVGELYNCILYIVDLAFPLVIIKTSCRFFNGFKILCYSYIITHLIPLILGMWNSAFLVFINAKINIPLGTNFYLYIRLFA